MRQCLACMWNRAMRERFDFYFPAAFCYYQQSFEREGEALDSNSMKF